MTVVKALRFLAMTAALVLSAAHGAHAQGDAQRGARLFPQCAACHTLEPGRNLTGPSLANLFGRKAGTVSSFPRYSDALKRSGVVWECAVTAQQSYSPLRPSSAHSSRRDASKYHNCMINIIYYFHVKTRHPDDLVGCI